MNVLCIDTEPETVNSLESAGHNVAQGNIGFRIGFPSLTYPPHEFDLLLCDLRRPACFDTRRWGPGGNDNFHCRIEENPEDIVGCYSNGKARPGFELILPSQMPSPPPGTFGPADVFKAVNEAGVPFILFLNPEWQRHVGRTSPNFSDVWWEFERTKASKVVMSPTMDRVLAILGEAPKLVTPLEFAISASAHARHKIARKTSFKKLPLVTNAVSQGFGEVVLLQEGTVWAMPPFRDNAQLCLAILAHFDAFLSLQSALLAPANTELGRMKQESQKQPTTPSAFISYSWDDDTHKEWVRSLAERLRRDGVDVTLDRWATVPGDELPAFMERAIRESQFVVIICTPSYKKRSDAREGGVGYEGDIMTAEAMTQQNKRKFIPVWRSGTWPEAAPSWLTGKYHINLTGNPYSEREYGDLVRTLLGIREIPPPLGKPMATVKPSQQATVPRGNLASGFEDIKITRVIVEEITEPRNDDTRGCALYTVPFALSRQPPSEWAQLFVAIWDHPPRWTTMHRPGIARVSGATVTLNGTTIEEVAQVHRDTLQLVLDETNRRYREWYDEQERLRAREQAEREERQRHIGETSKRITFD